MELDGRPLQNMASFVTTFMDENANKLMVESISKNFADQEEYPYTNILEKRCCSMLADLWNASKDEKPMGLSTVGSSEAIMLCGLAMKFHWKESRLAQSKNISKVRIYYTFFD